MKLIIRSLAKSTYGLQNRFLYNGRVKILSYSSYFYPYISGITIYQLRILQHLVKKNEIRVLTFTKKDRNPKNDIQTKGLDIVHIPYQLKVSKGFISFASFIYFYKECKKADAIIINIPNVEALPLAIIAKIMKKRVIAIYYCEVFLGSNFISQIINLAIKFSVHFQLMTAESIIAIPDYIESTSIWRKWRSKINTVIPPIKKLEVNTANERELRQIKKDEIWIGFIGRVSREKGIQYLIKAVEILEVKYKNLKLIFVGPHGKDVAGESDYFKEIYQLLRLKNISHKFYGKLKEDHLGALIKNVDMIVLPSVNRTEAFGMVQAEAMLLGTPVIASDMPGVRLPIKLTGMGKLTKKMNAKNLAENIDDLIRNKKDNSEYIKRAEAIFNEKKSYEEIEEIIQGK